jgi:hypothetical protein
MKRIAAAAVVAALVPVIASAPASAAPVKDAKTSTPGYVVKTKDSKLSGHRAFTVKAKRHLGRRWS